MKIIYYSPHPGLNLMSASGYGTHMREMINAFRESGHEVVPVIMGGTQATETSFGGEVSVHPLKKAVKTVTPPAMWRTLKDVSLWRFDSNARAALRQAVEKHHPDMIYERGNYLQMSGVEVARQKGIRHVMEINSPYVEETYSLEGAESYFKRWAYAREAGQARMTDQLVVVSSALKSYYIEHHQIEASRIMVVPNAINPADIRPDENHKKEIIRKYGLEGKTVVGYVGSIFKWHGVDALVDSFGALGTPDVKLLIVGGGELLDTLRQQAQSNPRAGDIIFTDWVPHNEIYDYISVMDIGVMARSNWYGSPVKIFEYGALGKAVIAPASIPVKDVMTDGQDGILIDADKKILKEVMLTLANDEDKRLKMGDSLKRKILKNYTWVKNAQRIMQL